MIIQIASNIINIVFKYFVHICNVRNRFASLIDDEAWTQNIWKFFNALISYYFDEFNMSIFDSDRGKVLINEEAELVAVLVKVQQYKIIGVSLSDFFHIFNS